MEKASRQSCASCALEIQSFTDRWMGAISAIKLTVLQNYSISKIFPKTSKNKQGFPLDPQITENDSTIYKEIVHSMINENKKRRLENSTKSYYWIMLNWKRDSCCGMVDITGCIRKFTKRSKSDDESSIEKDAAKKADANEFDKTIGYGNQKQSKENVKPPECPKDYIHVRARRGHATNGCSLAESVRIYIIFAFEDSGYRILYDNLCLDRFD
ncbi:transcription factor bHLH [Forsythia ovata]|uniref:Transcription factor bHLH n=1 Tax=Forsythia ovata TaxID=205694 RepID=A0ABD1WT28_9LAMI